MKFPMWKFKRQKRGEGDRNMKFMVGEDQQEEEG